MLAPSLLHWSQRGPMAASRLSQNAFLMDLNEDENLYMVAYRNVQMATVLEAFVPGIGRFVGFIELFVFKDDITCVDTMLYSDNTVCKVTFIYNMTTHEEVYNVLSDMNINVVEN